MLPQSTQDSPATAVVLRQRLWALQGERLDALEAGLGANRLYMADLNRDLEHAREAYVGMAVTEIAMLHADLSGRNQG